MKKVEIEVVRIDGGTQSRAELNETVVADYAEAIQAGASFPPVTVFHDGADYWLADGFHRYFAAKKAGLAEIDAELVKGSKRDAVLHSLGANTAHGLRRSNADKRKAVETLLADAEWALMSDREAARTCGVTHPFVASVRSSLVTVTSENDQKRTYTTKHGTTATMDTARIGKRDAESDSAPQPPSLPIAADEADDYGPSAQEIADAEEEIRRTQESFNRLIEADDKFAAATAEIKRLQNVVIVVERQRDGYMNEANEWKRRYLKLKREMERQAA